MPLPRFAALAACAPLLAGCLTAHFAVHATEGELELLAARRPIAAVLADPRTPARVRGLLGQIARIKSFGEAQGLRPTENYVDYVALRRPAAVFVVSACAPLRFASKTWSFPIAGDFPYLGWFDLQSARDYARDVADEGWDVDLRGASAFSTLGHFADPVLSTMLARGPEALGELAETVLHESAHATLHIEGQAVFNESFAQFVGVTLARSWLAGRGRYSAEAAAWEDVQARSAGAEKELHEAYVALEQLYSSAAPDDEKRARKATLLEALRARLGVQRKITNATLVQHKTYRSGGQGFARVYARCEGSMSCFLERMRRLTPAAFHRPHEEDLEPVLAGVE